MMTSVDSIGSCSLDAYASPSEASEIPDDRDGASARSLLGSGGGGGGGGETAAAAAAAGEEYVRRTARRFEPRAGPPAQAASSPPPPPPPAAPGRKPSYLGLACSVGGYGGLTTYDSKLREGFRARDQSPGGGRLPLAAAGRSPLPPAAAAAAAMAVNGHAGPAVNGENSASSAGPAPERGPGAAGRAFLAGMLAPGPPASPGKVSPQSSETSVGSGSQASGLSPSSAAGFAAAAASPQRRSPGAVRVVELPATPGLLRTSPNPSQNSVLQPGPGTGSGGGGTAVGAADPHQPPGTQSDSALAAPGAPQQLAAKSFIQQRIERLYGPGALAQAFLASRSASAQPPRSSPLRTALQEAATAPVTNGTGPALPVLRHLRPEFRAQLPLAPAGPSPWPLPRAGSSAGSAAARTATGADSAAPTPQRSRPPALEQQTSVESLPDLQPAAPEVPVPAPAAADGAPALPTALAPTPLPPAAPDAGGEDKDGHYFLKVLKSETIRLTALVQEAEAELLTGEELPEEALGRLRAAAGQASLLMKQKLQQFEGLCHKNIGQSSGEAFPTTGQDLAGFWDMVKLQVDHVDRLFEDIDRLRRGGWVESPDAADGTAGAGSRPGSGSSSGGSSTPRRRGTQAGVRNRTPHKPNDAAAAAAAASARRGRDEARRKLMEERRKAMRAQQQEMQQKAIQQHVEIFVPQENGK